VPGQETAVDVTRELLGEGEEEHKRVVLAIQQRRLNPEPAADPVREPSPRRTHEFYDVGGFCRYLKKFGSDNTVILADPARQQVAAILDETAERGFEVLLFEPLIHPLFAPWANALAPVSRAGDDEPAAVGPASVQLPLKAFLRFVGENRRQIIEPEGRDLAMMLNQVRLSRKVELAQGFGAKCVNGLMVETAIQGGGAGRMEPVDLPEVLTIKCPLYVATSERKMEIDIALDGDETRGVLVTLSSGDLPVVRVAVFEELLEVIRREAGDTMTVAMGFPRHAEWKILPANRT
jgi:hypothetical protein